MCDIQGFPAFERFISVSAGFSRTKKALNPLKCCIKVSDVTSGPCQSLGALARSPMNSEQLQKIHHHHMSALLEVDRICRVHKLHYFITGGTLLGAVRHGGFIPWDDDLDIGMVRWDYEQFLAIAPGALDDKFFLQTYRSDEGYFQPFAKLRVNHTLFMEEAGTTMKTHQGVFIDLFPIDTVPGSKLMRRFHSQLTSFLKLAAVARSDYNLNAKENTNGGALYKMAKLVTKPFRLATIVNWCNRAMMLFQNGKSGLLVNITGAYGYERETFPAEWLAPYIDVPFEGHPIMTMNKWHDYLTKIYGDYMTPPPPEKRKTGHEPARMEL
jgi:lipopolysaccharide cholinephosphotransferase